MVRNVLCLIGAHHWVRRRNEDGDEYSECVRCAAYRPTVRAGGTLPPLG